MTGNARLIATAIAAIMLAIWPASAIACSYPQLPPYRQELASARHVFVFRLLALRLVDRSVGGQDVVGDIEMVHALKGEPRFATIAWTQSRCGGLKLRVGGYYVAATRQTGSVLKPARNSILDVSGDFTPTIPRKKPGQMWIYHVANYLRNGTPFPEHFDVDWQMQETGSEPPLPPEPSRD